VRGAALLTAVASVAAAALLAPLPARGQRPHAAVNTPDPAMTDSLRLAIKRQDRAALDAALARGADVRAPDVIGNTPLHDAAIFWGDVSVLRRLVAAGARVDAVNDGGATPLLAALAHGHYRHGADGARRVEEVAAFLLARGAPARAADADGLTPAAAALRIGAPALIALLARHGAPPPDDALLQVLAVGGAHADVELVRDLVAATPPAVAAALARRRDAAGLGALDRAAESPRLLFLARWLLAHGADVHARGADGTTPLGWAAFHGNVSALELLHARGASLAAVTGDGQTPLHLAAYHPHRDALRWLLARGAATGARDRWGRTPLEVALDAHWFAFASDGDRLGVVAALGGTHADVARGRTRGHPLHAAMRAQDIAAVTRLLAAGADPNVRDENGARPLERALDACAPGLTTPAQRAFGERAVRLLLRHGADTSARLPTTMITIAEHARALRVEGLLVR
jgi:uncharacterized protein